LCFHYYLFCICSHVSFFVASFSLLADLCVGPTYPRGASRENRTSGFHTHGDLPLKATVNPVKCENSEDTKHLLWDKFTSQLLLVNTNKSDNLGMDGKKMMLNTFLYFFFVIMSLLTCSACEDPLRVPPDWAARVDCRASGGVGHQADMHAATLYAALGAIRDQIARFSVEFELFAVLVLNLVWFGLFFARFSRLVLDENSPSDALRHKLKGSLTARFQPIRFRFTMEDI
jgi:hypothetical protein